MRSPRLVSVVVILVVLCDSEVSARHKHPVRPVLLQRLFNERRAHTQVCGNDQFKCVTSGVCIQSYFRCNGYDECGDNSDEANCQSVTCPPGRQLCSNKVRCIEPDWRCDGDNDCGDFSDEVNCAKSKPRRSGLQSKKQTSDHNSNPASSRCQPTYCLNGGMCVTTPGQQGVVCLCPEGFEGTRCQDRAVGGCSQGFCLNGGECMSTPGQQRAYYCRCTVGYEGPRCERSSQSSAPANIAKRLSAKLNRDIKSEDEWDPTVAKKKLSSEGRHAAYQRSNTQWNYIARKYRRSAGSDVTAVNSATAEHTRPTAAPANDGGRVRCSDDQAMCSDGTECILKSWICDGGNPDCDDGSDELNCTMRPCEPEQFKCVDSGSCIRHGKRCDGFPHCQDWSDEQDCPAITCPPNSFKCVNVSHCVPDRWVCDGDSDCSDGSDENDCLNRECPADHPFKCVNTGKCIDDRFICDGRQQCSDGADEQNCEEHNCRPDYVKCPDNVVCVATAWFCDGDEDCHDGFDEANCNTSAVAAQTTPVAPQTEAAETDEAQPEQQGQEVNEEEIVPVVNEMTGSGDVENEDPAAGNESVEQQQEEEDGEDEGEEVEEEVIVPAVHQTTGGDDEGPETGNETVNEEEEAAPSRRRGRLGGKRTRRRAEDQLLQLRQIFHVFDERPAK